MANANSENVHATIAVMGATGAGKSTFIKHITGDENIVIGYDPESETFDVESYIYSDPTSGLPVMLVDTPGFDDSRDGVSDTDILEKIAAFLQEDGGRKLNGILYMHRISDPRVGGVSRKNLKMFRELCGDKNLSNVRIVTTNWDRVGIEEGNNRETALVEGAFKPLIDAGAKMVRQDNEKVSALPIVSEFIQRPPVEVKIVEEMKDGKTLAETSAGGVITAEMDEMEKKHEEEMANLKKEMEEAAATQDEQLKTKLAAARQALEERLTRLQNERVRLQETRIEQLQKTLEALRARKQKLTEYASRGVVGRYVNDVVDVTRKGAKIGGIPGAMVGMSVAPWVATKRSLFGR